MNVSSVLETCLYASDLPAAAKFYTEVLGLKLISQEPDRHVFFRCGSSVVLVFNPQITGVKESEVGGAIIPLHGAEGPGHLAFRSADADLDRWKAHLADHRVEIESEVDWPGGGRSLYFRDPAGNSLELATPSVWGLG